MFPPPAASSPGKGWLPGFSCWHTLALCSGTEESSKTSREKVPGKEADP